MPIASKVLHLGIVPSESKKTTKMSRSCSGFRAAEKPKQKEEEPRAKGAPPLEAAPRAKGAPPTKVAPNQNTRRAVEEAKEIDDYFAPKKGNKKGGMDIKTKSGNTNKKSAASMAKTKAPSQRSHQVKRVNPPLLCVCSSFSCAHYPSMVLSQTIEIFQRAALHICTYIPTGIHTKYIHTYKSLNALCTSFVLLTLFLVCRTRQVRAA